MFWQFCVQFLGYIIQRADYISAEKIADEFRFPDKIKKHYLKTINQLINHHEQLELKSIYIYNGDIFIIG